MSARRRIRSSAKGAATGGVAPELPSDVDHTAPTGSQTEDMAIPSSTLGPVATGSQTERMDLASVLLLPDMGTQTETAAFDTHSGTTVAATGSGTESFQIVSGTFGPAQLGQQTNSFSGSTTLEGLDYINTGSNTTPNGTPAWTNPANSAGVNDNVLATIAISAGSTANSTMLGTLLKLPATPAGFTRTGVKLRIWHRWDLAISVPLTDNAQIQILARDSTDLTTIQTVLTRTENDASPTQQTTVISEDFDISGLSDTHLVTNGIRTRCVFTGNLTAIVGGNAGWDVDAIAIVGQYSATGLT